MNDESRAENPECASESTEDLTDLGRVKEDTKGSFLGSFFDGGLNTWWG